jgi:peptidoglycan/LPS O-acetylase OafA/YrhL
LNVPSPASRPKGEQSRIFYLDGWRALAVLSVLFAHFLTAQGLNFGRLGVELFFVLSGRLMAEILFVRNTRLRDFFPRRLSRIYPALLVLTATLLTAGLASGGAAWPNLPQAFAVLTFTYNYAHWLTGTSPYLDHIWSLCIEEHMYLLLGLIAFIHRRRPLPLIAILVTLALVATLNGALRMADGGDYYAVYWRTDTRGASLLYGAIAYLLLAKSIPAWLAPRWMPLLLVIAGVALNMNAVPDPIKYSLGTICLATGLMLMQRAPRAVLASLENKTLVVVGTWSYSIYLWQQPFAKMTTALPHIALLPVAFGMALLSFYCVEQPARRFLNNRLRTRRTVVVLPPETVDLQA